MKNANARNEELKNTIIAALEDLKAVDITVISVADSSSVTDWMVIATGTSNRHVKALASNVEVDGKKYGFKTIGSEGNETAEWVLVDFGGVIVHVMLPTTRAFYDLESLWTLKHA